MNFNSFNLLYTVRLFLLIIFASMSTICALNNHWVYFTFFITGLIIITIEFIHFANSVNRKVAFFFDAVKNDDTTLHFNESITNKSLQTLHHSLNNINKRISELKIKNENEVKFYQEMMKFSATGIIAVNEKETVEIINNSALQIIGLPHISHLSLLKQKNEDLYIALQRIKPAQSLTLKILSGEELKVISIKVAQIRFENLTYRIFSLYDIKNEIEENELDSWQKLIRVITHEIMNSIAPITSLSTTLTKFLTKNGKPAEPEHITSKEIKNTLQGLNAIEKTSKGLMHFVEDYRKLTKIPKPVFKTIQIDEWIQRIIALNTAKLEENNIELKYIHRVSNTTFKGDEKLLTQVMLNLLNNSIDSLSNTKTKKIIIRVSKSLQDYIKISITDNGLGIEPEEIEKIFIPFYTTKEHGSGIGLSLARQIMRLHKGNITAFSIPGKKTSFTLNF